VLLADVSELYRFHLHRQVDEEEFFIHLPMRMEPIESSETSASNTLTLGNYPKESELHLQNGENSNLKSGTKL
jgi:hypothetical protein